MKSHHAFFKKMPCYDNYNFCVARSRISDMTIFRNLIFLGVSTRECILAKRDFKKAAKKKAWQTIGKN